jgi:hypothetical protein
MSVAGSNAAAPASRFGYSARRSSVSCGEGRGDDLRHPRQVGDLPGIAPGVEPELASFSVRRDEHEPVAAGKVAPDAGVRLGADAATVRRDDERERPVQIGQVGREQDDRVPQDAVVRDVRDGELLHERMFVGRRRDPRMRGRRREEERGEREGDCQADGGTHRTSESMPAFCAVAERRLTST